MSTTATLLQALTSTNGTERRHAALALGAVGDDGVVDALVGAIAVETDPHVREDLTWAIVQHAAAAEGRLRELVESADPADRRTAAHVLSKIAEPAHYELVRPLVQDQNPDVAIKAYRAAANTGGALAVDSLASRIGDGDLLQRDALTNAFASIGAPSVEALAAALTSGSADVREHAAEALGHLGEQADEAVAALERAAADPVAAVRIAAVSALGQVGEQAQDAMGRLAESSDVVVAQVAGHYLG